MKTFYLYLQKYLNLDLSYFLVGGFWTSLSLVVTTLGGIITSYLFAQFWADDVYGRYAFLVTIIGFLSITALPGMSHAVTQAAAEEKDTFFWTAYRIVLKFSAIGTFLLILGSAYFYFRHNINLSIAMLLCALVFPLNTVSNLYIAFLNGKQQFSKVAFFTTVSQFSSIVAIYLSLILSGSLILVAFLPLFVNGLISLYFTTSSVKKINSSLKKYPDLIKMGTHLSFSQLFTISADYFDRFIVAFFLGFSENAIYSFALILPTHLHNIFKIFLTLGQVKIAKFNQNLLNKTLINKAFQLEIIVITLIGVYIFSAPFIFEMLYPTYQKAVQISQIFALSLLYFPTNLMALNLTQLRQNRAIYLINIIYNLTTIISLLILIPFFGLVGAATAKIISRIFYSLSIFYFFKKISSNEK